MDHRGPPTRHANSEERESRYELQGTNTMSRLPHMERSRLFVGNVSPVTEKHQIAEVFAPYGEVIGVSVHKGYAFVQMATERQANKAINLLDQQKFNGNVISKLGICILFRARQTRGSLKAGNLSPEIDLIPLFRIVACLLS